MAMYASLSLGIGALLLLGVLAMAVTAKMGGSLAAATATIIDLLTSINSQLATNGKYLAALTAIEEEERKERSNARHRRLLQTGVGREMLAARLEARLKAMETENPTSSPGGVQ